MDVDATWEKLGKKIRPLRNIVVVATHPVVKKSEGGVHLPPTQDDFYDGLANQKIITATILAVGPKTFGLLKPGDTVKFMRISFARFERLESAEESYLGYLNLPEILCKIEP